MQIVMFFVKLCILMSIPCASAIVEVKLGGVDEAASLGPDAIIFSCVPGHACIAECQALKSRLD